MNSPSYHRDNCRLCASHDLELVVPLGPTPIADDYVPASRLNEKQPTFPLDLYLCRACGHIQLLDVVDPNILFGNYVYVTSISASLVEHFREYTDELLRRANAPAGALVIDVGSNDGSLLNFFKQRGMRVLGIDAAREIAKQATESGIETIGAFFTPELARTIKQTHGAASIVTANNVFAHADDLGGMAEGIRELLAPDGVFVFEVSYMVDIVEKLLFDTVYHEHLCYHSVKPLQSFLARHGMELIEIERIAMKGGSLRGTAQLAGGPRKVSTSVPEHLALEKRLRFDQPETFRAFAARIDGVKAKVLGELARLKTQGKTVAGFGASATCTTLLYHFDLGDKLGFIADDNTRKHNTFSPGFHLPVLPPQSLYERKPDYVVVLAWNYAQPILSKHRKFLEQGGHFIVPMPELRVV